MPMTVPQRFPKSIGKAAAITHVTFDCCFTNWPFSRREDALEVLAFGSCTVERDALLASSNTPVGGLALSSTREEPQSHKGL